MILDTPKDRMRLDCDCGGCSLAVVFGFHGQTLPEPVYALCSPHGMTPYAAEAIISSRFRGFSQGTGWTVADLEHHIANGRPVMALVTVEDASDHWVVVRGVENGRVYYHDPAHGRRSKSLKAWLKWWQGPPGNPWGRYGLTAWEPPLGTET